MAYEYYIICHTDRQGLSIFVDCLDGSIVSWNIGYNPNAELTNGILKEGTLKQKQGQKLVVQTDRCIHYRRKSWIEIMKKAGLTYSMVQNMFSSKRYLLGILWKNKL